MKIPLYQIDAFTGRVFAGNPAAVCPLDSWCDDALLQSIAMENNLSETAFFVAEGEGYRIRWFTPASEVDLCGHATLASAHVLFFLLGCSGDRIRFQSRSGELNVRRAGGLLELDFPSQVPVPCEVPDNLTEGLGRLPVEVLLSEDYFATYSSEEDILALEPDMTLLKRLGARGVIATAPGKEADFVSRFFAPKLGIDEDPVTGSAHCALTPYWSRRLGKRELSARQLSRRGGELFCTDRGERVSIAGRAVQYMEGYIDV